MGTPLTALAAFVGCMAYPSMTGFGRKAPVWCAGPMVHSAEATLEACRRSCCLWKDPRSRRYPGRQGNSDQVPDLIHRHLGCACCRCVRADETSATVRCHYLRDGLAKFAFTIGRAEFFIPVGILLKCFLEASDRELFGRLLATVPQEQGKLHLDNLPHTECMLLSCPTSRWASC